jgi:hypothetical protein
VRVLVALALVVFAFPAQGAGAAAEAQARDALRRATQEYTAGNFGSAANRLQRALKQCGQCSPTTRALLLRDLGTMQLRAGQTDLAESTWTEALKLKPDLQLAAAYDTPDVRRWWDIARGAATAEPPRGDFRHTPPDEQETGVALPIYAETQGTLAPARVVLKYRGDLTMEWSTVEMRKFGIGWGALIPCEAVTNISVRYYIQGLAADGSVMASIGNEKHPFIVPVHDKLTGAAPRLPGAPPPEGCAGEKDPAGPLGAVGAASTPSPTVGGGDVVEQIDLSGNAPPPTAAPPTPPPASPTPAQKAPAASPRGEFQMRGFARLRLEGLKDESAVATEPANLRVPWEPFLAQPQLFAELRYARGKDLEAAASGVVDYEIAARTTYDPATGAQKNTSRGDLAATLRELYVGTTQGPLDARIGQQRIAWGNSDAFPINDVLNPRDLRDPVLQETELRFLPTLALRADLELPSGFEISGVFEPFFTPDIFDVYGRPWALIQPGAPATIRGLTGALVTIDPSLNQTLAPSLPQARLPQSDLSGAEGALKIAYTGEGFDAAVAYDYGLSREPALAISPALLQQAAMTDFTKAPASTLAGALAAVHSGEQTSSYPRRHHVGAWLAKVFESTVFRAEVAYETATTLLSTSLLGVSRPTVQGVASIEWQSGEPGKAFLLEQYYEHVFGDDPGPLLGAQVETFGTAAIARWTFFDHLEAEVRGTVGEQPVGYIIRPQLGYVSGAWKFAAGLVLLDGDADSLPHYYHRNTGAYAIGRVAF